VANRASLPSVQDPVHQIGREYELVIEKTGDLYNVSWIGDGEVGGRGVDMELEHRLGVGRRSVTD